MLPWLADQRERLADSIAAGTLPHALIIQGASGSGRTQLALWLARQLLGGAAIKPAEAGPEPAHPDFCLLTAPYVDEKGKERKSLGVDLIRDRLLPFLELTSHAAGPRVALLAPADAMTVNAANSLLKTLEEPPAGTLTVLICDSLAKLPATVISRCQRVRVVPPDPVVARDWLEQQVPGRDFTQLLEFAGGAPLEALRLHNDGFADFANKFLAGLANLERRDGNPVQLAATCRDREALALRLLEWRIAGRMRAAATQGGADGLAGPGFRQLGQIRELRRVINSGIKAELSLAGLLLDWYGGLGHRQE